MKPPILTGDTCFYICGIVPSSAPYVPKKMTYLTQNKPVIVVGDTAGPMTAVQGSMKKLVYNMPQHRLMDNCAGCTYIGNMSSCTTEIVGG